MKSDGKWGTCVVTHPANSRPGGDPKDPNQHNESDRNKLDTYYEVCSPAVASPTTDLLRLNSTSLANPSPRFKTKSLSAHPNSTIASVSFSTKSTVSATPIGSPVSVPSFALSPWSPSAEEAKKLREPMLRQASLDTLTSTGRSPSPHSATQNPTGGSELSRFRSSSNEESHSAELNMLHTSFNRMGLGSTKNGSSEDSNNSVTSRSSVGLSSHRICGAKSPLSNSTSMADLTNNIPSPIDERRATGTLPKKVQLPPLVTNFVNRQQTSSPTPASASQIPGEPVKRVSSMILPFQGPASAAAFVPPIGHSSLQRNLTEFSDLREKLSKLNAHNTAAPGINASTWHLQKESLAGEGPSRAPQNQHGTWSAIPASVSTPLAPVGPLSALPHQIQQQLIINQQFQQLQQLQAQQQLLQQQQAQLLNSAIGLPSSLPTGMSSTVYRPVSSSGSITPTAYGIHSLGGMLHNSNTGFGYNHLHSALTPPGNFGPINGQPTNILTSSAPNPSRLQTTITGLPGLTNNLSAASTPLLHSGTEMNLAGVSSHHMSPLTGYGKPHNVPGGGVGNRVGTGNEREVQELMRTKGYNPVGFDLAPKSARFFVIKSYTEEDVHKSLKYEIWASTDLGNKRLDRAFNESHESGPIYLLFSVNSSGHFCGMAEMLTSVDYNTTSKVWAQDKWKGIFKVKWIFVKDIPNNALRHIKLTNTPENKPVTSSRDTQEVPYDKGIQVLQILSSFQARTSLLQDYAWYEQHENMKAQTSNGADTESEKQASESSQERQRNGRHKTFQPHQNPPIRRSNYNAQSYTNSPTAAGPVEITSVI